MRGQGNHGRSGAEVHGRWIALLLVVAAVGVHGRPAEAADLRTAESLFQSGQYEACRRLAEEEVERGVWNVGWPMLLIRCQMTTGDYAGAKVTYEAAAERFTFGNVALQILGIDVYRYNGELERAERERARLEQRIRESSGRFLGNDNLIAIGRYFVDRGEDARKVLELFYDRVIEADPDFLEAYIASAELALSKNDFKLAADTVEKAKKIAREGHPELFYLESLAWAHSEPQRSEKALLRALELNPRHVPSLLQRADMAIDAEQYEEARKTVAEVLRINMHHPQAWAYLAVLAHLEGDGEIESLMRAAALSTYSKNPEVDYLIGKKLSQKYRFAEGAAYQRRALEFDPLSSKIRFQLAQDLLRLGHDEEGWELVRWTQRDDPYNVVAFNLMELFDRVSSFTTLQRDQLIVRMHPDEAEIYGTRVLDLLSEAKQVLCEKYDVQPDKPIIVEIFPNQSDFAIRTFGLPGGAGFLGVCFGRVITANSPASQTASPTNWKSVLWHEFCHVVTLEKTRNRMPRWLSEGISVYEERQRDPRWGQQMTPVFREMILGSDLTPVSDLSSAFLRPKTAMHLQFAYYESSLVVEYLIEQHGIETLKRILDDLAIGMPINEALNRYTGSIDHLDESFAEYARAKARALGEDAQWDDDLLPERPTLESLTLLKEEHPKNYYVLKAYAQACLAKDEVKNAIEATESLDALYPDDASPGCATELLAVAYRQQEATGQEYTQLRKLAERRSDDMPTYLRLAELAEAREDWETLSTTAKAILAVNPLLPAGHRALARAGTEREVPEDVSQAMEALVQIDPVDPAELHYRWGEALYRMGRTADARRKVLVALEDAPRYRAAYRLLLNIESAERESVETGPNEQDPPAADDEDAVVTPDEAASDEPAAPEPAAADKSVEREEVSS